MYGLENKLMKTYVNSAPFGKILRSIMYLISVHDFTINQGLTFEIHVIDLNQMLLYMYEKKNKMKMILYKNAVCGHEWARRHASQQYIIQ